MIATRLAKRAALRSAWRRPYNPSRPTMHSYSSSRYLPIILQPSFWRSLVPKFLRKENRPSGDMENTQKRPQNSAMFYIIMALFIGSQAVQIVSLKVGFEQFSRETDAKLELLREVVRRYQAGEDVDVEAMLGTGDEKREMEWEEAMKEIEEEELQIISRSQKWRARKAAQAAEAAEKAGLDTAEEEAKGNSAD